VGDVDAAAPISHGSVVESKTSHPAEPTNRTLGAVLTRDPAPTEDPEEGTALAVVGSKPPETASTLLRTPAAGVVVVVAKMPAGVEPPKILASLEAEILAPRTCATAFAVTLLAARAQIESGRRSKQKNRRLKKQLRQREQRKRRRLRPRL